MRKASKTDYGYYSAFPQNLRKIMDDNNTTQAALAKECGVERQSVAQWRDGNTRPDILSLQKIAEFYNVSTDWLLGVPGAEKTTNKATKELCATLGLSDDAINFLSNDENQWGRNAVDFLVDQHLHTKYKNMNDPAGWELSILYNLSAYLEMISVSKDVDVFLGNDGVLKIRILDEELNTFDTDPVFSKKIIGTNNHGYAISFLECATREIISTISDSLRNISIDRAYEIQMRGYNDDKENQRKGKNT